MHWTYSLRAHFREAAVDPAYAVPVKLREWRRTP